MHAWIASLVDARNLSLDGVVGIPEVVSSRTPRQTFFAERRTPRQTFEIIAVLDSTQKSKYLLGVRIRVGSHQKLSRIQRKRKHGLVQIWKAIIIASP